MAATYINLEQLIGRNVVALNGHTVGRLEEVIAESDRKALRVKEYRIGRYAVLDRLSAWLIARVLFQEARRREEYIIPWDKLDISDPHTPRLTCTLEELRKGA